MTRLEDILKEGACLVGIGNPMRRDDGVGVWLAERLEGASWPVFVVEDVPENFVADIARSEWRNVVFIDAVAADLEPGAIIFGDLTELGEQQGLSTHKLALSLCGRYLEAYGKRAFLLGIVPGDLDFGGGLTPEVERAAARVRDLILRMRAPLHGEIG
jgi:hydrogenase maturation protease